MLSIVFADKSHIPVIQQLAYSTWENTYQEHHSKEQIDYMLHLFYDTDALIKQMDENQQFILAVENEQPLGFASFAVYDKKEPTVFRLHKIYINPQHQGKQIGNKLIEFVVNTIRNKNASALLLNVYRNNSIAVNFYKKNGFEIIESLDKYIGSGYYMNDYVMRKNL